MKINNPALKLRLTKPYEPELDFNQKMLRIFSATSAPQKSRQFLQAASLETPLGTMIAIADQKALYLLEFLDWIGLERSVERLKKKTQFNISLGHTPVIDKAQQELNQYFSGQLTKFKTPLVFLGTPFQMLVWQELKRIPLGETRSYADLARITGNSAAFRAVAQANAINQFAIMVPCHRVINANGALGGYGGGLIRKQWLLDHENKLILTGN